MRFSELIPTLQAAVGPVILISGVGLLLLSMTNRFSRVADRLRQLAETLRSGQPMDLDAVLSQLRILYKRARLLRLAITFATFSVLLAAILVITLFLTAFLRVEGVLVSVSLFSGCLVSLIVSLIMFLHDMGHSLAALKLEVQSVSDKAA